MGRDTFLRSLLLALCALSLFCGMASAQPGTFEVPEGDLKAALDTYTRQSGLQLIYRSQDVRGVRTRGVRGTLHAEAALERILEGTGLTISRDVGGGIAIVSEAGRDRDASMPAPNSAVDGGTSSDAGAGVDAGERMAASVASDARTTTQLEQVTVTGTRIRGGATPSPIITIGSERIREEGFADLGEVIRSVPQNFGGGQNPGVAVGATSGAAGRANQNITGGSSLNLRGLGPDATLTLLNGRRLAYGGFVQAVDIGAIPVEVVDRVEIVPDGASAIYGSDAVGGVGNVVLKRDHEGVTLGVRRGGATSGGLGTREYAVTAGAAWRGGGLIATWKDVSTDPIYARQRGYTAHMFDPNTLYPASDLRSGLASVHHTVADAVELRLDMLRTRREQDLYQWNTGLLPWYNRVAPTTTTSLVAPVVEVALPGDWMLSIGGSWGRDEHVQRQTQVAIATGATTPLVHDCYCNDIRTYEVGGEGPLFELPAGDARLAIGAGERRNEYTQRNLLTDAITVRGDESSRFAYAELSLPFVGSASNIAGIRRLDLTAALRSEDYDAFGSVTTPKLGLVYGPSSDFTLKASWGRSFKAPSLLERYYSREGVLRSASYYGGVGYEPDATVLALGGGNPDLGAERATTRSASLALHPDALPGFEAEVSWFDIAYTDRVVQPITNPRRALLIPGYAQFIDDSPTTQAKEDLLATADIFYNLTGTSYDPDDVVAIIYQHYVNVARQRINGVDLSASYRVDLGPGRLTVRGSASWLDSSQQISAGQDPYDIAGTLFNPAKRNARAGAVWIQGGFVASTFLNYTDGVENTLAEGSTASFTTIDATLRYATGQGVGALSGLEFGLSAQNLFNRDPPLHAAATLDSPPYDSTNYSSVGRFLSLSVSKHW